MLRTYQIKLRKNSTYYEQILWSFLRNRKFEKFKFRRQQIFGKYIVDFICYEKKLIIELDGGQHVQNKEYDDYRTKYFEKNGFKVMRFWNSNLRGNVEKILDKIYECLLER